MQRAKKYGVGMVVLIVLVLLLSPSGYFYWRYRQEKMRNAPEDVASLVKEVGALMELPDETPTVATVAEKEKLQEQGVFKKAENGDKVLFFLTEQRAVLYRPSTHKIIDVLPIRNSQSSQTGGGLTTAEKSGQTPEPTTTPSSLLAPTPSPATYTIAIYNGTTTTGLTASAETKIAGATLPLTVVAKGNAAKTDYQKSVLVDVTKRATSLVPKLTQTFNATVGALPEGEVADTQADLVLILGGQ